MKVFLVLALAVVALAAPEAPGGYNSQSQGGYDNALSSLGNIDIAQLLAQVSRSQAGRSGGYNAPAPAPAAPSRSAQRSGGYQSQQSQRSGGYQSAPAPAPAQRNGGYSSSARSAAPARSASSQYGAPARSASSQYAAPARSASSQYAAPAAPARSAVPARSASSQYGAPLPGDFTGGCSGADGFGCDNNGADNGNNGGDNGNNGGDNGVYEQQVHKHVYIHVAPSEAPEPKPVKPASAPLVPEKHYKILFIRAPEPAPYEQPDISDLPPPPEQKTLVYVLLKKPDATPAIQLTTPAPTKPSKPEVYFIRYKSPESNNGDNGRDNGDGAYGVPSAPVTDADAGSSSGAAPGSQYGAPSRQNGY